jgi:hypothetical protein
VDAIRAADVVVVPWEGRANGSPVFPQGSDDFIQVLTTGLPDARVSIAVGDDQYAELALHGNEWRLPTVLVTIVLLPAVAQILASRIDKWLFERQETAIIEMELIIEGSRGKCISIKYKGPPEEFISTLVNRADKCFSEIADKKASRHR